MRTLLGVKLLVVAVMWSLEVSSHYQRRRGVTIHGNMPPKVKYFTLMSCSTGTASENSRCVVFVWLPKVIVARKSPSITSARILMSVGMCMMSGVDWCDKPGAAVRLAATV